MTILVAAAFQVGAQPATTRAYRDPFEAINSKRDVWGEEAMAKANGPSYEFFEKLLPPLRYVNTAFHEYPIMLSAPLGPKVKARVISNGSGINCNANHQHWFGYPIAVTFKVNGEVFGADDSRRVGPTMEVGAWPTVRWKYRASSGPVSESVKVVATGPLSDSSAAVVVMWGDQVKVSACLTGSKPFTLTGHTVSDALGRKLLWLGDGWTLDPSKDELSGELSKGILRLAVCSQPMSEAREGALDQKAYCDLYADSWKAWQKWFDGCVKLEVPESPVNHAWRAVVANTLMTATGDKLDYSAGNVYQTQYEAECGDPTRALLDFGLADQAKRFTVPLLRFQQKGLDIHDAAFKLQLLADIYWKTRDADFVRKHRDLWRKEVDLLMKSRRKESGLEPKEAYCGDIHTKVDSLNANANAWRGLRDIAAVLRDMGEADEAKPIGAAADELREATLVAVEKSVRNDVEPPFVPVALFGAEKPYDTLTASEMGSYWDLMIPYVLGSEILDERRTRDVLDYLHTHGGICMGMIRFHQHTGLYANENGLDDMYSLRYVQALLRRDEVDRALVSFYGKLAQGFTRETFVGAEGTGLVPETPLGRPMYLPPNTGGNGFFLTVLRELMVQDYLNRAGEPEELRLLFATPRAWMEDGKTIRFENAPTVFGAVSVVARSELAKGRVTIEVMPPRIGPKAMKVRARLPQGWNVVSGEIGGKRVEREADGITFNVTGETGKFKLIVSVARS